MQAARCAALVEDLERIGEEDRRAGRTVAEAQRAAQLEHGPPDLASAGKRAEVHGVVTDRSGHHNETWSRLPRELHEAILRMARMPHVVQRAVVLDQAQVGEQSGEFVGHVLPLDRMRCPQEPLRLLTRRRVENSRVRTWTDFPT